MSVQEMYLIALNQMIIAVGQKGKPMDDRTLTINLKKDFNGGQLVELVELTDECIDKIADAVVKKIRERITDE